MGVTYRLLSSWYEAKQHAGRREAEKGVEHSFNLTHRQEEVFWDTGPLLSMGDLKAHPHDKATPTPTKSHLLIVPFSVSLFGPITVNLL